MARATHATISSNRVAHFENVGKQALEQSGKYRVNKNDEEVDGGSAGLKFGTCSSQSAPNEDYATPSVIASASEAIQRPLAGRAWIASSLALPCANASRLSQAMTPSRLAGDGLAERGLRRGETGDRHAVGRARDVVQSNLMAESDGRGIAAMFAADTDLQARASLAPARHADLHQFAHAIAVDRNEGVDLQNSLGDVRAEKARRVITADAIGGLGQVVGAE